MPICSGVFSSTQSPAAHPAAGGRSTPPSGFDVFRGNITVRANGYLHQAGENSSVVALRSKGRFAISQRLSPRHDECRRED